MMQMEQAYGNQAETSRLVGILHDRQWCRLPTFGVRGLSTCIASMHSVSLRALELEICFHQ